MAAYSSDLIFIEGVTPGASITVPSSRTGRLFLVREDGTVIEAPGVTPSMKIKSEEYAAIRDALGSLRGREAGYIFATLSNGESYLIGFADTGLKDAYPSLPWTCLLYTSPSP